MWFAVVILAVVLAGWTIGNAFAETKGGSIAGVSVTSFTDILTRRFPGSGCDPKCGDGAWGYSQSSVNLAQIEAHTQGANDHDIGWHFVDSVDVWNPNSAYANTRWTQAGEFLQGSVPLCNVANCYVINQSVYWIGGTPYYEYTSSDGNHSAESCFSRAGC